jgi:hypothetical protein
MARLCHLASEVADDSEEHQREVTKVNCKKIMGLAAIVATAGLALVGPPSATASATTTAWCKVREIPCEAAHLYPGGTGFEAKARNPKLLSALGNVECAESTFTGNLLNERAKPLLAELTSLTFTNCKIGTTNCELKSAALGHALYLRTLGYGGTVTWHNTSVLLKCVATEIHCVFGGVRVFNFTSTGGNATEKEESSVKASQGETKDEVEGEGEEEACAVPATWDTNYVYVTPTPIYLSS